MEVEPDENLLTIFDPADLSWLLSSDDDDGAAPTHLMEVSKTSRDLARKGAQGARGSRSPPRSRARKNKALADLSAVSRSLATPAMDLADLSLVSRSFAGNHDEPAASSPPANTFFHSLAPSFGGMMRRAPPAEMGAQSGEEAQKRLANMSSVSHNLANVGALPQCNQARDSPCAPPLPIADEVALGGGYSALGGASVPIATATHGGVGIAEPMVCHVPGALPRGAKRAPRKPLDGEKLEKRRVKNREAAERMRRRRREEQCDLETTVADLNARIDALAIQLAASEVRRAASEVENAELKQALAAKSH